MDAQKLEGHGLVGQFERRFNRLLPEGESTDEAALAALADRMALHEDEGVEDEPDPEENLVVPAGYT